MANGQILALHLSQNTRPHENLFGQMAVVKCWLSAPVVLPVSPKNEPSVCMVTCLCSSEVHLSLFLLQMEETNDFSDTNVFLRRMCDSGHSSTWYICSF